MPEIFGGWRVQIARAGLTAFLRSTNAVVGIIEEVTIEGGHVSRKEDDSLHVHFYSSI